MSESVVSESGGLMETNIENYPVKRGKVRDIYDVGDDQLLIVATDRISAFDYVLSSPVPDKGRVLTQISIFWMDLLDYETHLLSDYLGDMPKEFQLKELEGRVMLVRKCDVIPFECIARGYLAGSGWADYKQSGMVSGVEMPTDLRQNAQFPRPIFTPSTKEESGHDQNITYREMSELCQDASHLKRMTLDAYADAQAYAWKRGIIIADTKFEFGKLCDGDVVFIDEVLTPDSSRFWPLAEYDLGKNMPSFDKQFVRDYLSDTGWDKNSPPPRLPADVVEKTRSKYLEAYFRLTGKQLS